MARPLLEERSTHIGPVTPQKSYHQRRSNLPVKIPHLANCAQLMSEFPFKKNVMRLNGDKVKGFRGQKPEGTSDCASLVNMGKFHHRYLRKKAEKDQVFIIKEEEKSSAAEV